MKHFYALIFLASHFDSMAQELGLTGKQFFALSVSSTDSVSAWYEDIFDLELLKEIKSPDGTVDVRIIGNENLMVEILSHKNSRTISDCGIQADQPFRMRGIFKMGIYVRDVDAAQAYLKRKNVVIKNQIFSDKETSMRSFVISDVKQNLIQFIQGP
jgi:hypothetical protein